MAAAVVLGACGSEKQDEPVAPPVEQAITVRDGGTATTGRVSVRIPKGAVAKASTLSIRPHRPGKVPEQIGDVASPGVTPVEIRLGRKLRRAATVRFDVSGQPADHSFFVVTRHGSGAWRAVKTERRGDALVVKTKRFSDWWEFRFDPGKLAGDARHWTATTLGLRQDEPKCDATRDPTLTIEPAGTDALWPCLTRAGDGLELRLTSNRSVALSVQLADGWKVKSRRGSSLGEGTWEAVNQALEKAGGRIDGPTLPAGGELVLRSSSDGPARLRVSANNTGLTFDMILELFVGAYEKAKGGALAATKVAKIAVCLNAVWDPAWSANSIVEALAGCAAEAIEGVAVEVFEAIAGGVVKGIAGTVESLADVFGGSSSATLLIGDYEDPADTPPVRTAPEPAAGSFTPGAAFKSRCVVNWPTAPTHTSQGVQMVMGCQGVPQKDFFYTQVFYPNVDFEITPSTGPVLVTGTIVDIARNELGYSVLMVQADHIGS